MKTLGRTFHVTTSGKGTYEITAPIEQIVRESGIATGTVTVFIQHTSASLIIFENADRTARRDLHEAFERLVPEDSDYFVHTAEGPDDSTSHIRSTLTSTSLVVPVAEGRMQLGTWQGIFVFEHREAPHRRGVAVNVLGQ
ncbi:MAG TPA: secondary thiamine-phosphate synthase enzyme YjbQ [Terrimicrobiaceae bacterium]|nr:secondary thiamine-phosphate synthase enzyme YjbQ [Terrimicrobiaceae bacterium]